MKLGKKHKNNFTIPEREEKKKENEIKGWEKEAEKYYNSENYEEAIKYYEKIIKNNVMSFIIIGNIGECYFNIGEYEKSIDYYKLFLEKYGDTVPIISNIAIAYSNLNNYELSIEYFNKLLKIDEDNIDALNGLADCYYEKKQYKKAIKLSKKILTLDENNIEALDTISDCYYDLEKYNLSIKYSKKIIKKDKNNILALFNIAVNNLELENIYIALKYLNRIIDSKSEKISDEIYIIFSKIIKILIYYDLKKFKTAKKISNSVFEDINKIIESENYKYKKFTELKNTILIFYYYAYSILIHEENIDDAINYFNKIIKIDSTFYDFYDFYFQMSIYYFIKYKKTNDTKYKDNFYDFLKKYKNIKNHNAKHKVFSKKNKQITIKTYVKVRIPEEILFDLLDEIEKTKEEKIVAGFSHSIKNIIGGSITSQLNRFKENKNMKIIDDVQKGVNIITNIVEAMNLSAYGKLEYFVTDSMNTNENDENMEKIIINSFEFSIDNMFDSHYYSPFKEEYFPEKEIYIKSKEEFINLNSFEKLQKFLNKNMFNFTYDFDENILKYKINDENKSKTKLTLLFQEIIFNAVKYTAFVEKNKRYLNISLKKENNEIVFSVKNSCSVEKLEKSTGIGKTVIENICKIFNTKLIMQKENNEFVVIVKIPDFWKEKNE